MSKWIFEKHKVSIVGSCIYFRKTMWGQTLSVS
jgi:hypothetical protein